jgi:ribosomal protein S18 acetylase RimI-like enzyme
VSIDIPVSTSPIRKVNVRHDLLAVADLIELCFSNTLDKDGREYLRQLRLAARDAQYLAWLQGAAERLATPLYGFVWEAQGRIVGNLSLIPMYRGGRLIYLIANVAVHPDFRQQGIGHQLTQRALEYLRQRGVRSAWLQVRDDNPVAYHLYRATGFIERSRRTTWMSRDEHAALPDLSGGVRIGPRRPEDWDLQAHWLEQTYPADVVWNMSLNIRRLNPGWINRLLQMIGGDQQAHWEAARAGKVVGFVTWTAVRSASDALWLATTEESENQAVQPLLAHARLALAKRGRPLSVNYPAGRAIQAFEAAGFSAHQTLVWMEVIL